jgi:hypothetical protein
MGKVLHMNRLLRVAGLLTVSVAAAAPSWAADVDYLRDIQPIFKQRCWSCHGALQQQSQLRLDTVQLMTQGGASGAALVPGTADQSLLWQRISATEPSERMPPEGAPLTADQIRLIGAWIAAGAVGPEHEEPEPDPRSHWSFQPPVRAALPAASVTGSSHPVDLWIDHTLSREGLAAAPAADKATLLRRLYLDLIGMPPTAEELRTFLADTSAASYEQAVDRLLQDSRYGERWGRHWLDIWRYSDWYGRRHVPDVWNSAPQIWRWRDWVVNSLNADVGYDQMLKLMIAADEIAPEDPSAAVATGYLIRNWYALNPNDWMRNTVEHTGKAFLGLTINCAHCHDHKYDPISHDDYFRLRAFFEPISIRQDRVAGQPDPGMFQEYSYGVLRKVQRHGAVRIFDKNPEAPTWFYTGGDERNRVADRGSIAPGVPAIFGNPTPVVEPVALPPRGFYPGLQPDLQEAMRAEVRDRLQTAKAALEQARAAASAPDPALTAAVVAAESAYEQAVQAAVAGRQPGAIEGEQSLVLDATAGRRILNHRMTGLTTIADGMTLEFTVQLQQDAHFNVQLAKHFQQGLTAGYVAFEKGRIMSFQPGGTTEFEAGRYDFAAGQQRFRVQLRLDVSGDRCWLTVDEVPLAAAGSSPRRLVDGVPVALNGWNPVVNADQGLTFDARTGSQVVLDAVHVRPPQESASAIGEQPAPVWSIGFEAPQYAADADLVGVDGWMLSSFAAAPAMSVVSRTSTNAALKAAEVVVKAARRAMEATRLPERLAEAQVAAAEALGRSLEARIAAEQARYLQGLSADQLKPFQRAASQQEREAQLLVAQADVLSAERSLSVAEAKPADDAARAKEIEAAKAAMAAASTAVATAQTALADASRAETYTPLSAVYPATSTGRRRALADWLVHRQNPLTARVAVNHIWSHHFHAPLVSTVYDFGRNGARPTHPELLDWLAVEFMESGWSMRHLHRLIVTSQAYRRTSAAASQPASRQKDVDNRWLWRMNSGRMEVEVVRDSLLACAGRLDLTMGGQELENEESLKTYRRSLYYSSHPEAGGKSSFGELFDAPDAIDCYRRTQTIIPQQALALTNSELVHAMAKAMVEQFPAASAEQGTADLHGFVVEMFERVLTRQPTETELRLCVEAIEQHRVMLTSEGVAQPLQAACESLVRVLFNHNDFVTIR